MRRIGKLGRMAFLFSILLILACVTINIYFPAEKVESVAGEIVEDIRGPLPPKNDASKKKEKSSLQRNNYMALLVNVAWAEDVTTVSNPTIRTLKQKMKDRFTLLKPYFQKGMLKEGSDGYVSTGDSGALSLKERRDLNALVAAENNDRKALYREVAAALSIDPSQTGKVAAIFAKEWQKSLR
ncbi:MAG: DUF1318 domain-containing protein [Desulfobacterales bacterium]|jgi:hypothetical protein